MCMCMSCARSVTISLFYLCDIYTICMYVIQYHVYNLYVHNNVISAHTQTSAYILNYYMCVCSNVCGKSLCRQSEISIIEAVGKTM